jgi:pimeloyl-ACP methyl ester carboxylesterase
VLFLDSSVLLTASRSEYVIFLNQGLRMAYDDFGSGFPILFVHGHPFNRSMWSPQVQSLRWRSRTIAPDLRGYGESERGSDSVFTQENFACDLARLLDHLSIDRACVIGLSMGGQIAMEFARAFPQRTAALILAATFAQGETPAGVTERNRAADRMLVEGIVPIGSEMLCKLISPATLKNQPLVASKVFQMICQTNPVGAAAAVRGRALRRDYRPSLAEFIGPSMIVLGADDAYTSLPDGHALQSLMSNCRLEIFEGIGHMPNLEDEDRFNQCLHSFLDPFVSKPL